LSNPQPVVPAKDVAPSIPIASQLTPSPQSSSSSEAAVQLADSYTHTPSIEPVAVSPKTDSIVKQTVETFLHHTPQFEIEVSGSNVKIVDTKLSDAASPDFGVLTYHLSDGSILSIVGIIPHHHAPATA
jgi:hypothetical protein